jgi:putative ABC transport system permease protein
MVGRDGRPIRHRRAANLVLSWPADPALAGGYTLRQGRPPGRDGEAVLDAATARAGGWRLGDRLGIVGADGALHRFRVVGVTGFAGAQSPASALDTFDTPTVAVLQTAEAQRLLGRGDTADQVLVRAAPGVAPDTLRDRIAGRLPAGRLEVVTAADLAARQVGEVQGYLDGLRATLLAFAAVALLVGSFIIWNTFSVLVAGRTRELALLRLLGATRRQVLGSVLAEATVVGLVAAAAGVAAGVGAAVGLEALLRRLGDTFPPAGLVVAPRTVLAGLAVGTLVTVAAALAPARRASRVAPLEAIREAAPSTPLPAGRARVAVGLGLALAGAAGIAASLAVGTRATILSGLGALAALLGVMALGPVLAPRCAEPSARRWSAWPGSRPGWPATTSWATRAGRWPRSARSRSGWSWRAAPACSPPLPPPRSAPASRPAATPTCTWRASCRGRRWPGWPRSPRWVRPCRC